MEKRQGDDKFIDIDKVFHDKNPRLKKFIPKFLVNYLKRITHQDEINEFIADNRDVYGIEYAEAIIANFQSRYEIKGAENIPKEGRYVFVANHPLGGLDGMVFVAAVGRYFRNLKFPVNDILMNLTNLRDIFLPINKHGGHSRDAAKVIDEAYASDNQMLMFPAGLVSRKGKNGIIKDLDWKPNFIKKAKTHKRDIVPVHISGENTKRFYNLANWRKKLGIKANIEMLYLVDELYLQRNKTITITFGQPINISDVEVGKASKDWAQKIKDEVYALAKIN
ncbi:1-acyl-sn-glycerol-3-phosphate acyltransferase [Carboxylicivirga mesophila]|uniref:1-acyl-sn-glycerol-3-phosphate acyltransferase n=1 Tax=Carboxylicivirga mesophila TaxID=1166478 RepID=A0ABS5KCI8_9BACT|nr:1-acyl-sn-glycerol-3-phosphate acyltransferase [Carboxylicivirga mesophila]MBS2212759.1 1-acyl-sn-glycerol-3-phosphate acyltransferase [Carboxylicivirga mesophila]